MTTKRKWLRYLGIGCAALGAVLVLAAVFLLFADHGYLKPQVERELSKVLGRQVSIDGIMHLRIGNKLRVSVNGLRIASESWASEPDMVEVGRIGLSIDTLSLLAGPVEINRLVVDDARVLLEKLPDGKVNWKLGKPGAARAQSGPHVLPVVLHEVAVRDSRVEFDSPDFEQKLVVTVDTIDQAFDDAGVVNTRISGSINATAFEFQGWFDSLPALLDRGSIKSEFRASVGRIELQGRVALDDLERPERPVVDVTLTGPDYAYLATVLRLRAGGNGPLAVHLQLLPDGERMRFDVDGTVGRFHLRTAGHVDDLRAPRVVEADVDAAGPNLANVAGVFDLHGLPPKPFALTGHVGNEGELIVFRDLRAKLGDTSIVAKGSVRPAAAPAIELEVRSDDLELGEFVPNAPAGPFALQVSVVPDGQRSKFDIDGTLAELTLRAAGSLDDLAAPRDIDAEVDVASPDLSSLAPLVGADSLPARPFAIAGYVGRRNESFVFRDTRVQLGKVQGRVSGNFRPGSRPAMDLELESDDLELGEFVANAPSGPLALKLSVTPDGQRSNFDIGGTLAGLKLEASGSLDDLAAPRDVDAEVDISGPNLARVAPLVGADGLPARPFAIAGYVGRHDERLVFRNTRVQLGRVQGRVNGNLRPGGRPDLDLELASDELDLGEYYPQLPAAPLSMRLRLAPDGETVNFDVRGTYAELKLEAAGRLDDLDATSDVMAEVGVGGANLAAVAKWFDVDRLPAESFALTGQVDRQGSRVALRDARASVGQLVVEGSGSYEQGDIPKIELTLQADELDLSRYLPGPKKPAAPKSAARPRRDRLIPDTALPFDALRDLDFRLVAGANALVAGPRKLRDISLRGAIAGGSLSIEEFRLTGPAGATFQGAFAMRPDGDSGHVGLRLDGQGLDLGLPAESEAEHQALPHYDVRAMLDARGLTLRQLASSANGYMWLKSGKGRIRAGNMRVFTSDFLAELLSKVNPFLKEDPYTNIQCATVATGVQDGVINGEPGLVIQSDRLNITARARVDLRDETFDADINTVPRKGLGVSLSSLVNPYIGVGGTLASPHLRIDRKSTILEGGAAIATGGISIVAKGMFDRVTASTDPCGDVAAAAAPFIKEIEQRYGSGLSTP